MQIRVQFIEKNSQDNYEFAWFDTYEELGYWYLNNWNKVIVWEVKEV